MNDAMRRRTDVRDALSKTLGTEVADMLVDYMPTADWTDGIDRRFEEIDRRFEEIDRRFEEVNRRFEEIDRRLGRLEDRMDRLEARVEGLAGSVQDLASSMQTWTRWMITSVITSTTAMVGMVLTFVLAR